MASSIPGSANADLDERSVREVLERSFACVDRADPTGWAMVFTPDVLIEYFDGALRIEGLQALVDRPSSAPGQSIHVLASTSITISGDRAEADSLAMSYRVLRDEPTAADHAPGTVTIRALRYRDRLTRNGDGWRIEHRRHSPLFQTECPETPLSAHGAARP